MNFQQAVQSVFGNYATFEGRAGRAEFWWFFLFLFLGNAVMVALDGIFGTTPGLAGLFSLGTLLPALAVDVRRLHDIGRSGWWLLISLVPVVGFVLLLVWFLKPGTQGPNRFGPPAPTTYPVLQRAS